MTFNDKIQDKYYDIATTIKILEISEADLPDYELYGGLCPSYIDGNKYYPIIVVDALKSQTIHIGDKLQNSTQKHVAQDWHGQITKELEFQFPKYYHTNTVLKMLKIDKEKLLKFKNYAIKNKFVQYKNRVYEMYLKSDVDRMINRINQIEGDMLSIKLVKYENIMEAVFKQFCDKYEIRNVNYEMNWRM